MARGCVQLVAIVSQSAPSIYVASSAMFIGDQLVSANPGLSGWNQFQIRTGDAKETLETQLTKTDGRFCKLSVAGIFVWCTLHRLF